MSDADLQKPPQPQFEPRAVLDGSKLILNTKQHQAFQVDHSLKIIFASSPLRRTERSLSYSTYVNDHSDSYIVIDSGIASHVFIPIVLSLYGGLLYTRDGTAHVVLSGTGDIKRSKVSSKALPHKIANKFSVTQHLSLPQQKLMPADPRGALSIDSESPVEVPLLKPWKSCVSSVRFVEGVEPTGMQGIVFIRADQSIFRYTIGKNLKSDEEVVEFQDGRATAWTAGVEFRFQTCMWCCKRVSGASGRGTLWIDNPKQIASPGPTALAA